MHTIRLRDPWEVRSGEDGRQWVFTRKFHRPTGVELQPVQLAITVAVGITPILRLNGATLAHDSVEQTLLVYPVTNLLLPFNVLELHVSQPTDTENAIPKFGSSLILAAEMRID